MTKIDQYLNLAQLGRWEEALSIIEEIVSRDKSNWTSWFNYGVCLEGLMDHGKAAEAFKRAYGFNREDKGIQYRVFRSLALSGDTAGFMKFLMKEIGETPELFELLEKHEDFLDMINTPEYIHYKRLVTGSRQTE